MKKEWYALRAADQRYAKVKHKRCPGRRAGVVISLTGGMEVKAGTPGWTGKLRRPDAMAPSPTFNPAAEQNPHPHEANAFSLRWDDRQQHSARRARRRERAWGSSAPGWHGMLRTGSNVSWEGRG